ncbi:MAG: hypothetical protein J6K90_05125 [Tidjanibacter sp.]|nr:hypothetical protein [Tidjanibacter sp.]
MEIKNITTALEIVGLILKGWDENGKIDEMERTVVLKKLKEIGTVVGELSMKSTVEVKSNHEELPSLFEQPSINFVEEKSETKQSVGEQQTAAKVVEEPVVAPKKEVVAPVVPAPVSIEPEPESTPEQELVPEPEPTPASIEPEPAEPEVVTNSEKENEEKQAEESVMDMPIETSEENLDFEFVPDAALEQESNYEVLEGVFDLEPAENLDFEFVGEDVDEEHLVVMEDESEEDSEEELEEVAPADEVKAVEEEIEDEPKEDPATAEEELQQFKKPHKLDRKTINRLYGDDDDDLPLKKSIEEEISHDDEERPLFTDTTVYNDEEADDDEFTVVENDNQGMVGLNGESETVVLGEILNAGQAVLGDSLGEEPQNIASIYGTSKIKSLRNALGVNDMFLVARDLFGGNVRACEAALDELDKMQNIDDALLYIHDNFNWDRKREGTQKVMDVLMRKLM